MSASRSRVQGLWAAAKPNPRRQNNSNANTSRGSSSNFQPQGDARVPVNQRTEFTSRPLTFQPSPRLPSATKVAPRPILISERGNYVISDTANGKSMLWFDPNYLDKSNADWMFDSLLNELSWKRGKGRNAAGEVFFESRLTAWFSDYPYSYARVTQRANPHWHPLLTSLLDRLTSDHPQLKFNSLLANRYPDGHSTVSWHADNEPALGNSPQIASISFGDTRAFELRQNPADPNDPDGFEFTPRVRVSLGHGSLLLMLGATQLDWQHRIPKEYHDRSERVNLTFRRMHPTTT